jgi:hypothetical protein
LYLQGNITNAEAAAIITAEAGPQTQFVYIRSTTNLTHVDLGAIENLVEFKVLGNRDLVTVSAPNLKTVSNDFSTNENKALTTISLPKLSKVYGDCSVTNNRSLNALSYTSLASAGGLTINDNESLTSLTFPSLRLINYGSSPFLRISDNGRLTSISLPTIDSTVFLIYSNPALSDISIPKMTWCSSLHLKDNTSLLSLVLPELLNVGLSINGNSKLAILNFPKLITVEGTVNANYSLKNILLPAVQNFNLMLSNNSLKIFELPQMKRNAEFKIDEDSLDILSMPALVSAGYLYIKGKKLTALNVPKLDTAVYIEVVETMINSLEFPSLRVVKNAIYVRFNPSLSLVSIPVLNSIGNALNPNPPRVVFIVTHNKLPSSQVNILLAKLVSINPPIINSQLYLNNNLPPAPPTGQGIADKNTLSGRPNDVVTD